MTTEAWVPTLTAWRFVLVGDVFYSAKTDDLWTVTEIEKREGFLVEVRVVRNGVSHQVEMDPDAVVPVLVGMAERDALAAIGATTIERTRE